jgi:hypothetical protein|tara:strand:- start:946 stop:2043 length:1098 start_codon:yes stop_codon:yes gene_type:complete
MKTLDNKQALYCAGIFNDYFGQFNRIDQYMRDQKLAQIESIPTPLPGMGLDQDIFLDFNKSPADMKFAIEELDNDTWNTLLNMTSSHSNMASVPGKQLKLAIKETTSNKWVGFIRFGSPVINCKPRNNMLGNVPDLPTFNKTAIMGFVIVPTQPFGFNYLGGKLLAAISCSHWVREKLNEKYGMNLVLFETTSLYGNSKSSSQYDGMKPFLRYKGLTDSDFIPLIHGKPYRDLVNYVENIVGAIVKEDASSRKLKMTNAIIGLVKRSLEGDELKTFSDTIVNAKKLTERKRYYVGNFGIDNYIDIVNGKATDIVKGENYDKFNLDNVIEWWRKKALNRYTNLQKDGRLRTELEVWTENKDIQIIR